MSQTIIKANTLFDGKSKQGDVFIVCEGDKIIDITKNQLKADFEGIVTPGFIDPHSHIGMFREGEHSGEQEGNDFLNQFMPTNNALNGIYFDDRAFKDAVDFGVLYSCVVPGSGNLMGGKSAVIKNFGTNRDNAFIKDVGYKMALGFNPRSTTSWGGERPNTRMGVYAMLEKYFDNVLIKKEKADIAKERKLRELEEKQKDKKISEDDYKKELEYAEKEYWFDFNNDEKAVLELLTGSKKAKIHVHKDDDVLYLIEFVKKYKLNASAEHTGDVFHQEIFEELAKNDIPVIYGPLGSVGEKIELKNAFYQNTELLMKSGVEYGLMTDHPVVYTYTLRDSLKYFMMYGMNDVDAISLITHKNAKLIELDDVVGSIETGKLASLIVWDGHPLYLGSFPKMVMGEGKILRQR